ncbi:MAG TPA: hypothetical protein VE197_18030, partial [Mycobacterium sp.]|nr:hypothetical protein [Mycobacterium sp.]
NTLAQNGDALRRSLQSAGVNLLRLDIEARTDSDPQTHHRSQDSAPRSATTSGRIGAIGETDARQPEPATVVLPGGALVNVFA